MKNLLTLLIALLTIQTFATSLMPSTVSAQLVEQEQWRVDDSFGTIHNGELIVDTYDHYTKYNMTLNYEYTAYCPEGMACIQMVQNKKITLPITKVTTDACGTTVYTAESNQLYVHGHRRMITVTSHQYNICMHLPVNPYTKIHYLQQYFSVKDGSTITQEMTLYAETLR